jgi:hypothetical protein
MRKLGLLFPLLLLFTAGCPIYERPWQEGYSYCDATGCYWCDDFGGCVSQGQSACQSNYDCAGGCYCGPDGLCIETNYCSGDDDCTTGLVCDSRSSCVPPAPAGGCDADADCASGSFCDERTGACIDAPTCTPPNGSCGPGRECDARGTCVPIECTTDNDCPTSFYCDETNRQCVPSRSCYNDTDCASLPGTTCNLTRSTCEPPDGEPGCQVDADCGPNGTCCNGVCEENPSCTPRPIEDVGRCTYDGECGGGDCRITPPDTDGVCHAACTDTDQCGTGDICRNGFCDRNPAPTPQCLFNRDCTGGGTCINGTCHAACTTDAQCTNPADFCDQGICQPDWRVVSECTISADCTNVGEECVDGQCRTRCMQSADCALCVDGPACVMGYCEKPE